MEKNIKNPIMIMLVVLFVFLVVFMGTLIGNQSLKSNFIGLDSSHLPTIEVRGEGRVHASPDQAEVSFAVITQAEDTQEAITENNEKMERVINYLKEEGIDESDIKTSGFNIIPLRERREDPLTREYRMDIYAYEVRNSVEVLIRDLEKAGEIVDGGVRAGANSVNSLRFIVSDEDSYKNEAREMAIKEAKDRAQEIASALGVSLKRTIAFSEDRGYPPYFREAVMAEDINAGGQVPLEPGESEIIVNVNIRYEIR